MRSAYSTIAGVVADRLCHGCGNCAAFCPEHAISILFRNEKGIFEPLIDDNKCSACGICTSVCSGQGLDYAGMYNECFGQQPTDPWMGVYSKILTSCASDIDLRFNASSGGSLTALLTFLLNHGHIRGAVVTRFDQKDPLMPRAFIAASPDELIQSIGSKYCPVPVNEVLSQVCSLPGTYAFVGLPCHVHSLRLSQLKFPELKHKITFIAGLMCSNTSSLCGTRYFLKKTGIDPSTLKSFSYRGNGWTGSIGVTTPEGTMQISRRPAKLREKIIHQAAFHTSFSMLRCLTCCDHMNEFSDVSFGDPRYRKYLREEKTGKTLVILRTQRGEDLYQQAVNEGYVVNDWEVNPDNYYEGQNISFKKGFRAHLRFNRWIGRKNPEYKHAVYKPGNAGFMRIFHYLLSYIAKNSITLAWVYVHGLLMRTVFFRGFWLHPAALLIKKIKK